MAIAQAVALLLEGIGGAASFVSQRTATADDLQLEVDGAGRVRLPISPTTARKLIKLARPAQHGYKNETRLDRRVRDTFEIDRDRITLDGDAWQRRLHSQLEHIRRDLGLPEGCRLHAELHNLLIYAPGQFFVSHQDSEKNDAMVASLVVGLPSTFSGGGMWIEHQGVKAVIRGSTRKLSFTAFYADCQHEVRPVKQGYRLALTYNLFLEGKAEPAGVSAASLEALSERLHAYFAAPLPPRWKNDGDRPPPDRWVYLLDHQYTRRGLDWTRLKGADAARVSALQALAAAQDYEICLALVDVHEVWNCEDEFDAYPRRRYGDWIEDEEEDEDDSDHAEAVHELTELLDSDATLRHFVAASGKPPAMNREIDPRELGYSKPSVDFTPFESMHEGYMGNYGNTVERWYHRAAVVLWPRNRAFAMRARAEPRWALGELAKTRKARGASAAVEQARMLLSFWAQSVRQAADGRLLERALAAAADLASPALAEQLLTPFSLPQLKARCAPHWLRCLERYGLPWCKALLVHWLPHPHAADAGRLAWIVAELPSLCQTLRTSADLDGRALAQHLLLQEWRWLGERWSARHRITSSPERDAAVAQLSAPLLGLLDGAARIGDDPLRASLLAALGQPEGDCPSTPALALGLLRAAQAVPDAQRLGLAPLRAFWSQQLTARLAQAPRRKDDWSIDQPLSCRCKLCSELAGFLRDAARIRHEWPLAEQHRKHLHRIIEDHALPLSHTTRRSGRPYVLLLEKTEALFAGEAALREQWQRDLAWLAQAADAG
jgi:hypothetical protein